jgi:hypothetical protein
MIVLFSSYLAFICACMCVVVRSSFCVPFPSSRSPIDCTFSGSTGVVVLLDRKKVYCANVGDSRAVLGQIDARGKLKAVALSDDQKPDRPDEAKRIVANGGRVEACQGPTGPVGPARVWLLNDDVPGLAMSR